MKNLYLIVLVCLLSSCIKYREEWTLKKSGGGSVKISCCATTNFLAMSNCSQAGLLNQFFMPSFHNLTQNFAEANLSISDLYVATNNAAFRFVVNFERLENLLACPIFRDRIILQEWGYKRKSMTFFHSITPNSLIPEESSPLLAQALNQGFFEIYLTMPYGIASAEGATNQGCKAFKRYSFKELGQDKPLFITIKANDTIETVKPSNFNLLFYILMIVSCGIVFALILRMRKQRYIN